MLFMIIPDKDTGKPGPYPLSIFLQVTKRLRIDM